MKTKIIVVTLAVLLIAIGAGWTSFQGPQNGAWDAFKTKGNSFINEHIISAFCPPDPIPVPPTCPTPCPPSNPIPPIVTPSCLGCPPSPANWTPYFMPGKYGSKYNKYNKHNKYGNAYFGSYSGKYNKYAGKYAKYGNTIIVNYGCPNNCDSGNVWNNFYK